MTSSPATKNKKRVAKPLTNRQQAALKMVLANTGKPMGDILREVGYGEGTAKNPHQVTRSAGFAAVLDRAGISDTALAKKHKSLLNASKIEEHVFWATKIGRKYRHVSDEFIKMSIEGADGEPTGCQILVINKSDRKHDHSKTVIFRHPDNNTQKGAIELAYKVKGHMAPDSLPLTRPDLSPDDAKTLTLIFNLNNANQ